MDNVKKILKSTLEANGNPLKAGLQQLAHSGIETANTLIDQTKLPQFGKDALRSITSAIQQRIPKGGVTGSSTSSPISKPPVTAPTAKPEVKPPVAKDISWWDKVKNFFAGVSNTVLKPFGVAEAHTIKPDDYNWDDKTGERKDFSWEKANQNFETDNGRPRQGWDVGRLASSAMKLIK